ncbi:energy transducer TonB [Flavobacteriaceae bacterium F08102]|nr:energy transducer TonB [Flavobacteriaceae bacterium F08102]
MAYLDTPYKKKSAVLTSVIMALIVFLIFTFGMKYFDPPKEYGIAVNFGTSEVGNGNTQPTEPSGAPAEQQPVEEVQDEVEEAVEEVQEEAVQEEASVSEDVATQDNAETIRINKEKEAKRKEEAAKKKAAEEARKKQEEAERKEKARLAAIAKKKAEEDAKKAKLDALMSRLNNSKGDGKGGGEGNDNQAGDKGDPNGDPNASGYYGNGGGGSGENYHLENRKALWMPMPVYDCNEQGTVKVIISVDKNGRVIAATPVIKGTTNSAPCLLKRAKEAALKTKFNPVSKASKPQVGHIIYNFSLSK